MTPDRPKAASRPKTAPPRGAAAAPKKPVHLLVINGLDDRASATILSTRGNVQFAYGGNLDMGNEIESPYIRKSHVLLGAVKERQAKVGRPDIVFNGIADPDGHSRALHHALEIIKTLTVPVLNHPEVIRLTTRDNIHRLFRQTPGVIVPKTVRATPRRLGDVEAILAEHDLGYPFLMRPCGDHGGKHLLRVAAPDELDRLEAYAFDGRSYYLTEFVDFRDADGLYRKYRLVVVDGAIYPRHMIVSDDWNVHARSRERVMKQRSDLMDAERAFIADCAGTLGAQAMQAVRQIYATLALDYFGIDCARNAAGELVIFEINACVNIMLENAAPFTYLNAAVERVRAAVAGMVLRRGAHA